MSRKAPKVVELKKLLALCGNVCAFPDCNQELVVEDAFIGNIAHINAAEPGGPRYLEHMSDDERASASNLLLLCPTHHTMVDKPELESRYSAESLKKMKLEHEKNSNPNEALASDAIVDQLIDSFSIQQANINTGNGTQLNNQTNNIFYDTKEFADHRAMLVNNLNASVTEVRRLLKTSPLGLEQVQGHVNTVGNIALSAVKDADNDLLENCINQLRKVTVWCFNDYGNTGKVGDTNLVVVTEMIIKEMYLVGSYAVDIENFTAIRMLTTANVYTGHAYNWAYRIRDAYLSYYRPSDTDLFEDIRDFVITRLDDFAWTEEEVTNNLMIFEYLGNIYTSYENGELDFPMHIGFYRQRTIYAYLDRLIGDEKLYELAFPKYKERKLAEAIAGFDGVIATQQFRDWRQGFRRDYKALNKFIENHTGKPSQTIQV